MMNTRNMDWNIEKRYITRLLFVVDIFLICIFKCMLCPNAAPELFEFLYIKCFVIGYESGGNDLKATGDVATFT